MIKGWVDLARVHVGAAVTGTGASGGGDQPAFSYEAAGSDSGHAAGAGGWVVCSGRASFRGSEAQNLARNGGDAAAWLHLLSTRGVRALDEAAGAFALAYLDLRSATLILATDRFAVRPLCYSLEGDRLSFSSRADGVPRLHSAEIDVQALFEYIYFHVIPTPSTVFRGVHRLRGGQAVVANAGSLHAPLYWTPKFAPEHGPRLADLEREFLDIIRAGVVREAQGRKTACFLSGGTDSSTVTGMLAQAIGAAPDAYSIGFDAQGYDEMQFARIAARHFGARHHEYYITPGDLVSGIPRVARHYDQPFGNSSAVPAFYCASQALDDGFDCMLAGDGGDELFGGNSRYAKQRVFAVYDGLPSALRRTVIEPLALGMPLWSKVPLLKKGVSYVRQARLPMPERMETYNLLERLGVNQALTPRFMEAVDAGRPRQQQREVYDESGADLINAMLAFDWKYTLVDNDLPKVCGTADLAGIAVAFPLLTAELTDFSLRLPPSLKVRGLTLRYFFKRALRDFLPQEILRKRKHGFGLPFGPWLLADAALQELAADSLAGVVDRGLIRQAFVDELLGSRVREVPGYYGGMVWVLMMLEQWLRQRAPAFRLG